MIVFLKTKIDILLPTLSLLMFGGLGIKFNTQAWMFFAWTMWIAPTILRGVFVCNKKTLFYVIAIALEILGTITIFVSIVFFTDSVRRPSQNTSNQNNDDTFIQFVFKSFNFNDYVTIISLLITFIFDWLAKITENARTLVILRWEV